MKRHPHVQQMDHGAMKQTDLIFCLCMMQRGQHQCLNTNSKFFGTKLGEVPTLFYH